MTHLRHQSPKGQASAERAAAASDFYTPLQQLRDRTTVCEMCFRHRPLEDGHVAQGFRYKALEDVELILRICSECHRVTHRMAADDGKAMGLALLQHAGRGNLEHFYKVTGRRWPDADLVKHWDDRLGLKYRRAGEVTHGSY